MKYKITLNGKYDMRSISKNEFLKILKNNKNKIPDDINRVIIYCASWSCNGAKYFFHELVDMGINIDKIVDYKGSIHEWASYSGINPKVFTFHSTENNNELNQSDIKNIRIESGHEYFIDNVLKNNYVKNLSNKGKIIKQKW